jgi:hypothetical protein
MFKNFLLLLYFAQREIGRFLIVSIKLTQQKALEYINWSIISRQICYCLKDIHISNFTCARYYFLYVEFSGFYVNQSLAGYFLGILNEKGNFTYSHADNK